MKLLQALATNNPCYKQGKSVQKITGIVVHSTGCDNEMLRRYVQPSKTDKNYDKIMKDLGKNLYNNDLNQPNAEICMHAFIGQNDKGEVETYQTLPYNYCCWGCGSGSKGSYNYPPTARIQFEICEDSLTDKTYFDKAFKEAIEYCAYLCKQFSLPVTAISSHKESCAAGYASNHGDPENWLSKYGKTMDWFRAEVKKLLDKKPASDVKTIYRVQVGAYSIKENAEAHLKRLEAKGEKGFIVTVQKGD